MVGLLVVFFVPLLLSILAMPGLCRFLRVRENVSGDPKAQDGACVEGHTLAVSVWSNIGL